jgi:hypothetical protein
VTLSDADSSETFVVRVYNSSLPAGSRLFTGTDIPGDEIFPLPGESYYELPQSVIEGRTFYFLPPGNWSSANPLQGDITLVTETIVTDSPPGGGTSVGPPQPLNITVKVTGIADIPVNRNVTIPGTEDQPYDLGAALAPAIIGVLGDVSWVVDIGMTWGDCLTSSLECLSRRMVRRISHIV